MFSTAYKEKNADKGQKFKSHFYGKADLKDEETLRITLAYIFTSISVLALLLNAVISLRLTSYWCSLADFITAALLLSLVLWPKKRPLQCFIHIGIGVAFFLFLFLHTRAGENGFLWSFLFPLFTFFLLGCRQGLFINILFLLTALTIILCDTFCFQSETYSFVFTLRYTFAFLLIVLFSYCYEYFRKNSEEKFKKLANEQKQIIDNRTKDLHAEFIKTEELNKKLFRAKSEWEKTFDSVSAQISIIDTNSKIIRTNKATAEKFGLSPKDLIGQYFHNIIDGLLEPQLGCSQIKQPCSTEIYCEKSGKHFYVTLSPLYDDQGTYSGFVHVANDITSLKTAQDKLEKSRKMEAIGRIASEVAHDLNNILSGVVTYPQLLLHTTQKDNPLYEPLESIQESGQRASDIVADLLTITRGISIPKKIVNLNDILQDYFNSIEFKNLTSLYPSVILNINLNVKPLIIRCIPSHIQKMVMNLITNAIEAVEIKGRVSITLKENFPARSSASKSFAHLTIEDDGAGINKKNLDNIFEPFYSNKEIGKSGTGLGLSIVKNIAEDHGASLTIESELSKGTAFDIKFPICEDESLDNIEVQDISILKGSGSILVVDDDRIQRKIAVQMLEFLGYTTHECADGEQASSHFHKEPTDIVFLDQIMVQGKNGIDTYQDICNKAPNVKAILTSGYVTDEVINQAHSVGINKVLEKPYSLENLAESIKKLMDS